VPIYIRVERTQSGGGQEHFAVRVGGHVGGEERGQLTGGEFGQRKSGLASKASETDKVLGRMFPEIALLS
jgi:hypothetical protein